MSGLVKSNALTKDQALPLPQDAMTRNPSRGTTYDLQSASRIRVAATAELRTAIEPLELQDVPQPAPMSKAMLNKERMYFVAMCFPLFLAGWNDASAGPLLPRMQATYHVGYAVVSLIFISNCVGCVSAALLNIWLTDIFGFGIVITFGALCQSAAYCIQAPQPPFPLLVISYCINGFGEALQDAQSNGLVASLPTNAVTKMSILHGVYGLGAFISPLVATQFAQKHRWTFHFLTSLAVSLMTACTLAYVTRFKSQDELLGAIGTVHTEETPSTSEGSKLRQMMELKVVHLMALFIFVYVGVEVTIGGWIVTFIIHKRGGSARAGYVSSGFFGGLTIGRVALIWVNQKVGERRVLYIYGLLCIALELTIWLVPSLIENAIAVALIGALLGPFYPIVMNVASALIPRRLLTGSIGWIASLGQTGSAAFPFILAVMAQKHGVQVLQPLIVAMIVFLLGIWLFVAPVSRRTE